VRSGAGAEQRGWVLLVLPWYCARSSVPDCWEGITYLVNQSLMRSLES